MEIELKDIGIALIVGSFTILAFEFITWYSFGARITGFFKGRLGLEAGDMRGIVFLFICFGVGLVTQDVFHKSIDAVNIAGPSRLLICNLGLIPDLNRERGPLTRSRLETATLVRGLSTRSPSLTSLGEELAESGLFEKLDPGRGALVQTWLLNMCRRPLTVDQQRMVENSIQRVWYAAKDRIYRNETYSDEMTRLEMRQEFSAALAGVARFAWMGMVAASLLMLVASLWFRYRPADVSAIPWLRTRALVRTISGSWQGTARFAAFTTLRVAILVTIYFFALWAYAQESVELNKRAFGYYNSLVAARVIERTE